MQAQFPSHAEHYAYSTGEQGRLVACTEDGRGQRLDGCEYSQVWARHMARGTLAVGFLRLRYNGPQVMCASWGEIGLPSAAMMQV